MEFIFDSYLFHICILSPSTYDVFYTVGVDTFFKRFDFQALSACFNHCEIALDLFYSVESLKLWWQNAEVNGVSSVLPHC